MRDLLSFISFSHKNHDIIIFPKYLKFLLTALFFLAFFSSSALALQQLISLQGKVDLNGVLVSSGSVNVTIWDAATGGNVVYNSTGDFINSVQSGYFDITLGATTELNLSMNRIYWLDMEVNGNDIDWNGNERLQFQSPVGSNVFGNLNITDNLTVDTNTLYVDAINNRVGIGTASPYAGLQVNRTGTVLETNGTTLLAVSGGNVGINTASPSYRLQVAGNVSLNNSLYVTTAGNVGIGTAAPSTALDVRGRILLGGNDDMIFDNGQNMIMHNSGSNTLSIGTSGVANVVVYDRISITSASDLANVTIKNSTFIVRDGGVGIGTASPNAKLYVNDTLSNQHTLYVKNNATNPGLTIGYFLAPKATTSDTYILRAARNEGDNAFYVLADNTTYMAGNVGIGTTIPNATLQVMGAANILALNVNNTLYVNTTTSYVGIGTTGPTNAKLEIYTGENALNSNTGGAIAVYDTAGTALVGRIGSDSTIGAFTIFGDRGINLAAPGNNGIRFYQSTTERMRIADDTGNVGIGVTSPNSKLQVNGSILLGNANDIDFSIKPDSNIAYTGSSLYVSGGGVVGNGAGGNLYLSGGVGSSNQGQGDVYIYGGSNLTSRGDVILANDGSNSIGKVGINISSPTQMLTVKGDANITGTLYVGAQSFTTIDASGNLSIGGSASIISNITTNGSLWQPVYPSDDGLVLYLPFSEGIGTTAYDRSPYGNDGTLKNTSATCSGPVNKCPNWTTGKYGNALQFDGNETFVDVGSGASLDLINVTVTVEAWVKSSDAITASTDRRWISARSNGWDLGFDSGKVYFGKYKNTTCGFSGTQASFSANTWYHIAGVADPATCYIYINGVLDASATTTPNSNIPSGSGFVGAHVPLGSYRAWNGTIDEVRIYNRALSADEIRSQYLGGLQSHGTVVADKFRVVNTTGSKMFEVNQTAMVYNNSLLYVDNVNGRVGIGTTSPPDKLSINGGASAPQLTLYPGGTLFIDKGTGGISGGGYFSFASGTGVTIGMTDDSNSNHLIFKTRPAGGSETERVRIDSTGKVGINTTSPSDEVHLKGGDQTSYRVESTGNTNARYMMNNTQGSWGIMARGTTGNFDIYDYDMGGEAVSIKSGMGMVGIGTVNPTENLTVNGNFSAKNGNITGSVNLATSAGNVGIGTTAPTRKLVVYDLDANVATISLKTDGSGLTTTDGLDLQFGNNNSYLFNKENGLLQFGANNTATITISAGNNVGIGTTNPNATLNVRGGVNVTGSVNLATLEGNVGIGTTAPEAKLHVEGEARVTGQLVFTYGEGSPNWVGAKIDMIDNADFGYLAFITRNGAADINERMRIDNLGNVGIGTAIPQQKLDVNGTLIVNSSGNVGLWSNGTNVGIGTTSPGEKLTIQAGNIGFVNPNIATQFQIYANRDDQAILLKAGTTADYVSSINIGADSAATTGIQFGTQSLTRMAILGSGNVGIGTTSPQADLALFGDVELVDAFDSNNRGIGIYSVNNVGRLYIQGKTQADIILVDNGSTTNNKIIQLYTDGGVTSFRTLNDAASVKNDNLLVINHTTGNVGIGTAGPGAKLHIGTTTVAYSTNLWVSQLAGEMGIGLGDGTRVWGAWTNHTVGPAMGSRTNHDLGIVTNDTVKVTIKTDGNVGIGTTSPGNYKLNVAGTVNASAYVTNGTDYAEMMEKLYADERIEPGDVVGIVDGKATKRAENADSFMIVSENPGVIAGEGKNKVPVAFIGQVKVTVKGKVSRGDYILANKDGIAIAKPKANVTFEEYKEKVIGTAWESRSCMTTEGRLSDCEGIGKVLVAVGIK